MSDKANRAKTAEPGTWGHKETRIRVVVAGIIGGGASALVAPIKAKGFHGFLTSGDVETWTLFGGLAILGVLLVWLFKECDINKALCITAGFPALVVNVVSDAPKVDASTHVVPEAGTVEMAPSRPPSPEGDQAAVRSMPTSSGFNLMALFVGTASAQQPAPGGMPATAATARSMEFYSDAKVPFRLECLDAQKGLLKGWDVTAAESEFKAILVPSGTTYVRVLFHGRASAEEPLRVRPGDGTIEVGVSIRKDASLKWQDLLGKAAPANLSIKLSVNSRPKAPVGLEGWVFLGSRSGNAWKTTYAEPLKDVVLAPGTVLTTTYPLNMRDAAASKNQAVGVLSKGQQFEVQSVSMKGETAAWAKIKVKNTNNPDS